MKVVLLKPFLVARSNGGEISMIERLRVFQSWGVEVQIHIAVPSSSREASLKFLAEMQTPLDADSTYKVDGLQAHVEFAPEFHPFELSSQPAMEEYFRRILEREQPDLVWAHYTDYFSVSSAIRWNAERSWVILTDNEYPRQMELNQFPSIAQAYLSLKTVVVASKFMQTSIRKSLPWVKPLRIPNPVESFEIRMSSTQEQPVEWVFVNPVKVKGIDFLLELAEKSPSEKFLILGNWATALPEKLPANARTLPRQHGLQEIFKNAKGLLMPSVWDEAFGRIALEAMAARVPVIASNRGSLPETVGGGGQSIPLEIPLWQKAMKDVEKHREKWTKLGLERVSDYRQETLRRYAALKRKLGLS